MLHDPFPCVCSVIERSRMKAREQVDLSVDLTDLSCGISGAFVMSLSCLALSVVTAGDGEATPPPVPSAPQLSHAGCREVLLVL